jgi:hypothetical protein
MDEIVKQALAKWPNVPHCTGWMLLDRRGTWRMRDEAAQAAGALGAPVRHAALLAFIARNYEADANGQWYFQNGPQRVYVELAYTPWIVRLVCAADGRLSLVDHTGGGFEPAEAWLDDAGGVLFRESGPAARTAALHDHDLGLFADHADFERGPAGVFVWNDGVELPLQSIARAQAPAHFGFVSSPAAQAGAPDAH